MIRLIAGRLLQMLAIMAAISFIVFALFDSDKFRKQIAVAELGALAVSTLSQSDYNQWLERKGLNTPLHNRYSNWLSGLIRGDFGYSIEKDTAVGPLVASHLARTGLLALCVFALMIPLSLMLGVMAGMRQASRSDRLISVASIVTTSIPEIAIAIFLTALLALGLGWLPAKSAMHGNFEFMKLILPVLTLVIFDFGYVTRITRASMIEVMQSDYIRTAILKGLPQSRIIMRHALRNALIAPFTVIVLQINWIISGVVVVETFFQYEGVGKLLVEAARFGDVQVIQAITLVAVGAAVASQLLSDISYAWLDPRTKDAGAR
ncbi:MAG: ABC transporter permease [Beijerinckiaceae bacterium]|jgi:peptide/nickel transport system permease protein|nr:ABC transporter permease [Beijerinckiaceae bacterium]